MTLIQSHNGLRADLDKWNATRLAAALAYQERRRAVRLLESRTGGRVTVRRAPIKPVSDKRRVESAVYRVRRLVFLEANPVCQWPLGCADPATTIQHRRGRIGDLYLDERLWAGSCVRHNLWAENHPIESKALGWSLPRVGLTQENGTP